MKISLLPPGARVEIVIDTLDDEGRGRGMVVCDGHDVDMAVRGAWPGDRVRAVVQRIYKSIPLLVGRVTEVIEAGPARIEAKCPHRAPCVGCPTDTLEPSLEIELKRGLVESALARAGLWELVVDDVEVADTALGRRQKVKLVPQTQPHALGLFVPGSHRVVDTFQCARHHPALRSALSTLHRRIPSYPPEWKAIVARVFREGVAIVVVTEDSIDDEVWLRLRELYDEGVLAGFAERLDPSQGNSVVGGVITRQVGDLTFTSLARDDVRESVDQFCQPDPWLAERMYRTVAAFAGAGSHADLYAGTGGFTRHLEGKVIAVEESAISAKSLDALFCDVHVAKVGAVLDQRALPEGLQSIVMDPPRKGLREDAARIAALQAERLALVSCEVSSLERDLPALVAGGYRVERVVPFDLFAGTPRVEVLSLLTRVS